MPLILIYGLDQNEVLDSEELELFLEDDLPQAASSVPEMRITPDLVSAFAIDAISYHKDVIVLVEGLFQREERTPEVLQLFTDSILACVRAFVEKNQIFGRIEVIPRTQRPTDGFAGYSQP